MKMLISHNDAEKPTHMLWLVIFVQELSGNNSQYIPGALKMCNLSKQCCILEFKGII